MKWREGCEKILAAFGERIYKVGLYPAVSFLTNGLKLGNEDSWERFAGSASAAGAEPA